jgi:hypothetical protein
MLIIQLKTKQIISNIIYICFYCKRMKSLIDFIYPFNTVDQYLRGLVIVDSLYSEIDNKYQFIQESIKQHIGLKLDIKVVQNFAERVTLYKHDTNNNALFFINTMDIFKNTIYEHATLKEQPTLTLTPNISQCYFCHADSPNWFIYKPTNFNKMPTAYLLDRIS